jgi:SAM-dependent methyltransferase
MRVHLRTADGGLLPLHLSRWLDSPQPEEEALLDLATSPVLDVGCGPGRHVVALAQRGVVALGVDASPAAVEVARLRGAPVLERSVFDRLPGLGRWGSVLLLDGSIGIGGDPTALLRRVRELLRSGGRLLVELAPPGTGARSLKTRVEAGGRWGPWFPWALVDPGGIEELASRCGFSLRRPWCGGGGRWFALLDAA